MVFYGGGCRWWSVVCIARHEEVRRLLWNMFGYWILLRAARLLQMLWMVWVDRKKYFYCIIRVIHESLLLWIFVGEEVWLKFCGWCSNTLFTSTCAVWIIFFRTYVVDLKSDRLKFLYCVFSFSVNVNYIIIGVGGIIYCVIVVISTIAVRKVGYIISVFIVVAIGVVAWWFVIMIQSCSEDVINSVGTNCGLLVTMWEVKSSASMWASG